MATIKKVGIALIIFYTLILNAPITLAATLIVPDNYVNIQDAIDAASAGDTVLVYPDPYDSYAENINMKIGVDLISTDRANTIIEGTVTGANDTRFENFTVIDDGSSSPTLYECLNAAGVTIKSNVFIAEGVMGNFSGISLPGVTSAEVINNSVYITGFVSLIIGIDIAGENVMCANNSLYLEDADIVKGISYTGDTHTTANNIVVVHAGLGSFPEEAIAITSDLPMVVDYNLLVGAIGENVILDPGNLYGVDPCYVDGDLALSIADTSPAKNAADPNLAYASGVTDIGTYPSNLVVRDSSIIQSAIDAAAPGETILIEPGVYQFVDNLEITKSIRLTSQGPIKTILELGKYHILVRRPPPGPPGSPQIPTSIDVKIEGLTIKGYTYTSRDVYGPIRNIGAKLTLKDCRVVNNEGVLISAIYNSAYSELRLENTLVAQNVNLSTSDVMQYGGHVNGNVYCAAIYLAARSKLEVQNSTIADNINASLPSFIVTEYQTGYGGQTGYGTDVRVTVNYGAILRDYEDSLTMLNSIMWDNGNNTDAQDFLNKDTRQSSVDITYCDLESDTIYSEGITTIGTEIYQDIIHQDPEFIDPANSDYNISAGSPCEGTGEAGADMGAFFN